MAVEPPFREPPEDAPNPETFRAPESGFTPVEEGPQGEEYPSVLPVTAPAGEAPLAMLPKRPMPGFWLSALACFLMIFVTQIVVPLGVLIILIIVRLVRAGDFQSSLDELGTQAGVEELQRETMLPLLATAHVSMIFIGLLTLRLFAGRDWRRAVALRWPSVSHTLLLLVGFPAMPFVSGGVYLFAQRHIAGLAELPALLISQIAMVAVFGLAWLAACIVTGRDWKPELARSPLPVQWPVSLIVVVVGVAVASATFGLVAPHMPQLPFLEPLDKGMEDLARDMRLWHPALAVLVVAGCPALSEELWCRAFLGRGLVGQYGIVVGIVVTSYFFGAIHVLPHQGVMAMVMGLMLFFAYVTTRSLVAPMLLHFLNNSTSVLGSYLGSEFEKVDTRPEEISLWLLLTGVLLLLAVGWALYRSRARLVRANGDPFPAWQPPFPGVALPPPDSDTVVAHAWPGWLACALVAAAFTAFVLALVLTISPG